MTGEQEQQRQAITNDNIREAVELWCADQSACIELFGHIKHWDVSAVTDMRSLFWDKRNFNQDVSQWNVGNVTNMNYMFSNASAFNQDVSQWNVSNVADMRRMFANASAFNQDLSRWNLTEDAITCANT